MTAALLYKQNAMSRLSLLPSTAFGDISMRFDRKAGLCVCDGGLGGRLHADVTSSGGIHQHLPGSQRLSGLQQHRKNNRVLLNLLVDYT